MDFTPVYELRDRLKAGAIAGTELAAEDFRLIKAVEAFAPLAGASPVFAKISQTAQTLFQPDCPDRAGALLDTLTLVDAVLCTQGAVAVKEEGSPIVVQKTGAAVVNAPYSVLASLLDALTNSGGGRYSFIMDTHKNRPELFQDYRVKAAMVDALGASYGELAEQVARWLKEDGKAVFPVLKRGFDPQGKREMVRRIQVIEAVAGSEANDFYLSQLPSAQKEVRQALIYALRHSDENVELLLELVKTEKGNARKMALCALAHMEREEAAHYWEEAVGKKPEEALKCLCDSGTTYAEMLTAKAFQDCITPFMQQERTPLPRETAERLESLLKSLPGKGGEKISNCYRAAAALDRKLDRTVEDGSKKAWTMYCPEGCGRWESLPFSKMVPVILWYSLLIRPDRELETLAGELYHVYGAEYIPAALTAQFLTGTSQEAYQWVEILLEKKTLLGTKQVKDFVEQVQYGLSAIVWEEEYGGYVLKAGRRNQTDQSMEEFVHPLEQGLDERFFDLLIRCGKMDSVLARWVQPGNSRMCERFGRYFYEKALTVPDNRLWLGYMKACGFNDCTGLAQHYFKNKKDINFSQIYYYAEELPGDHTARAAELERLYEMLEKGRYKMSKGLPERLKLYIEEISNTIE